MAHPIASYDGNYITCYPGSNQEDDGKLQLEFNMARLVTRLSSKNFCITNPSFELTAITSSTGTPQISVGTGQCSINGMDIIVTTTLTIDPPETPGDYYLAFHLHRDSSNNVLGDLTVGISKTFEGLYLTYYSEKIDTDDDPDIFYLGKLNWDGTGFSNIEEDLDKYGRIWARDVLCKLDDPKHPNITRILLQDWIYKVPDWYVSKEGDVEYGNITWLAGRNSTGTYGIDIKADTEDLSHIDVKAPSISKTDPDRILKIQGTDKGILAHIGRTDISVNSTNNYDFLISSPNNIQATSSKNILLYGDNSIVLATGLNHKNSLIQLTDNELKMTDDEFVNLEYKVNFLNVNELTQTVGKSIWKYNAMSTAIDTIAVSELALLIDDTKYLRIEPEVELDSNLRVNEGIYIGSNAVYGSEATYLKQTAWKISDPANLNNTTDITPKSFISQSSKNDGTNDSAFIKTQVSTGESYAMLRNNGVAELKSIKPTVLFKDAVNTIYDAEIYKTNGARELNIDATQTNVTGNMTAVGDIRARKVYNAVYNDIAEFMEKADYEEVIEPGDVVYFNDEGKVTKWHIGISSTAIAGVVSSEETYGYALGGAGLDDNQKVPIALKGRVYVKTDNTSIKAGDLICVDACGCVYKGDYNFVNYIYVVGIATQSEKDGKVLVMLK